MIDVGEVAMLNTEEIEIGERARCEMGDLEGLEGSMRSLGLAQPICVKRLCEPVNGCRYLLLGGARRFGVLIKNGNSEVPCRVYPSNISDIECKSIELAENFFRKDFEYWEYDNLVSSIHILQQQIHGPKVSTARDAEGWGMQETGEMMGITKASVSTAIKRQEARDAFPELFDRCRTQRDATKVLDKLQEAAVRSEIAKKVQAQRVGSTLSRILKSYITGNFFDSIKEIPDRSMKLVEIDPPYGIALTDMKKKDGESKYILDEYKEVPAQIFMDGSSDHQWKGLKTVFKECYRVLDDHSWLICWFAPEPWFDFVYKALREAGFGTTRMVGIWTKGSPGAGQCMNPNVRLANCYETFFYAWKGKPALAKPGKVNQFHHSPVPSQQKTHPTERPVSLMKELYETFAWVGSNILIPFLGSGNGLFAAEELNMNALGFELSKAHKDSFIVKANAKFGAAM